jgi:hypothetical protein
MAADSQPQEVQPSDLFGRWLAHHEQQVTDEPSDEAGPDGAGTDPAPPAPRRSPRAAVPSSALANDPVIGRRVAPPSDFGGRRPATHGSGTASAPDREPPPGWEPIVMRSARKKTETPLDRPGRLARLKARLIDPAEPAEDFAPVADPPQPPAVLPPAPRTQPPAVRVTPPPVPLPAAPAPAARSIEETIRAAVAPRAEQVVRPAPVVEAEPELVALVEPEPVVAAEPLVEPEPVPPEPAARSIEETIRAALAPRVELFVEPVVEAEPVAVAEPEPVIEPGPLVQVEPEPVAQPDPQRVAEPRPMRLVGRPRRPEPAVQVEPEPVVVAEPVVEPEPEPKPEPEPEPETIEAEPEPAPVPEPPPADEAPAAQVAAPNAQKSFRLRARTTSTSTSAGAGPSHKAPVRPVRAGDAARELVAAKAAARAASPTPQPERRAPAPPEEVEPEPVEVEPPLKEQLAISKQDEVAEQMPGVYAFVPKRSVRRVLTLCLLAGLATSAYFVRAAVEVKETPAIGLAAIIVLATGMVWAIRAGASVTTLTVRQGQLEVVQQGGKHVFDMASEYTMVEVHGEPGRRGWKVLFPRRGMAPFAIDASMVDPDDFMRVLRFFRPSLVHH